MNTTKVKVTFSREVLEDCDGDTSYLTQDYAEVEDVVEREKYKAQDAARLATRGTDWHFIAIRAKALIRIDHYTGDQLRVSYFHELTSNGLYGIESDSGESYFAEVFEDECAQLRADIEAMKQAEFQ
jgi:hypothetical protein